MAMTVVVTSSVASRFRGFLASCMLEIAPGVYTSPTMTRAVRERIWKVCSEWYWELNEGSIVMTWHDREASGRQGVLTLGVPAKELCEHEGHLILRGRQESVGLQKKTYRIPKSDESSASRPDPAPSPRKDNQRDRKA